VNHTVSAVRVRSKTEPAVTEVRPPPPAHMSRPSASRQPPGWRSPGRRSPRVPAVTHLGVVGQVGDQAAAARLIDPYVGT
jgi:hypothetical protein